MYITSAVLTSGVDHVVDGAIQRTQVLGLVGREPDLVARHVQLGAEVDEDVAVVTGAIDRRDHDVT